jgi:hypothetical protein
MSESLINETAKLYVSSRSFQFFKTVKESFTRTTETLTRK